MYLGTLGKNIILMYDIVRFSELITRPLCYYLVFVMTSMQIEWYKHHLHIYQMLLHKPRKFDYTLNRNSHFDNVYTNQLSHLVCFKNGTKKSLSKQHFNLRQCQFIVPIPGSDFLAQTISSICTYQVNEVFLLYLV